MGGLGTICATLFDLFIFISSHFLSVSSKSIIEGVAPINVDRPPYVDDCIPCNEVTEASPPSPPKNVVDPAAGIKDPNPFPRFIMLPANNDPPPPRNIDP